MELQFVFLIVMFSRNENFVLIHFGKREGCAANVTENSNLSIYLLLFFLCVTRMCSGVWLSESGH